MTTVSLTCAKFQGNITAGLFSILETEQYADVTIAVEGKFLKAHQMVLSICSPYFNSLLESTPCKHPIIFIKGVKYNIMKHLLRFMYEGETEIDTDKFQCFIETARELQIKWLTRDNEHNTEASNNSANTSGADRVVKRERRSSTPEPQQLDFQPKISKSKCEDTATGSNDTQLRFAMEEANNSNQEDIVQTTIAESLASNSSTYVIAFKRYSTNLTTVSLTCSEFQGNITAGFLSMLETEQYANVTIAVEGQYLKAHQMVLSICSPYFKSLLQSAPCKHPIIFIKGVKYNIMKHLLRFMYEGRTEIAADDFQCFINSAREFQIKWLTEVPKNRAKAQRAGRAAKRPRPSSTPAPNTMQVDIHASGQEPMNSNRENVMLTDYELLLDNMNANIDKTVVDSSTNADPDRFSVEPIDTTIDLEEMKLDNKSITDDKRKVPVEVIELDEDEDDKLLQPIYQAPQPARSQPTGEPVNILFYKKGKGVKCFVNKYSYNRRYVSQSWSTWRCIKAFSHKCYAMVRLTADKHIVFSMQHNHEPEGKVKPTKRLKQEIYHHRPTMNYPNLSACNRTCDCVDGPHTETDENPDGTMIYE